jgi:hypothetical protein
VDSPPRSGRIQDRVFRGRSHSGVAARFEHIASEPYAWLAIGLGERTDSAGKFEPNHRVKVVLWSQAVSRSVCRTGWATKLAAGKEILAWQPRGPVLVHIEGGAVSGVV